MEGSLWIATKNGLNRFKDANVVSYGKKEGIETEFVWSVYEDSKGTILAGTVYSGLLMLKDGKITEFPFNSQLPHRTVRTTMEDRQGNLWIGTVEGLAVLEKGRLKVFGKNVGLGKVTVRAVFEDRRGRIWVGTNAGLFLRSGDTFVPYPLSKELPGGVVFCIVEEGDGSLLIATGSGLTRINDQGSKGVAQDLGLKLNVFSVAKASDGSIVMATTFGLARLRNNKLTIYSTKEGLPDNVCYCVVEDREKNLWVTTIRGICRIRISDLDELTAKRISSLNPEIFNTADGMRSAEGVGGVQTAGFLSRSGKLWFPSLKGLIMIDPGHLRKNSVPPPVVVEDMVADNKPIQSGNTELAPGTRSIEFHYTALSLIAPQKNQFRYKLENFDKEWIEAHSRRSAYYTNIQPGRYTFRVTGCNNDRVWNQTGASFSFYLRPYFYQTTWFLFMSIATGLLLAFAGYRLRVSQLHAHEKLLEMLVVARTQELKQANEKAEKARSVAEAANQAKGMFLSRMSHEIRTPMNSVIGFSDMLLDTEMSEEQVEFVRNITKSGEALLSLINEILDFSKIEAGQLTFQNIDFDLEITAFDVCHLTQPRLGNKPVEVFCRVDENLPAFIKSDPTRLRQVLLNLISNAIKFTHEGEIELSIAVEEENERQLKLHTTVRDTGIGIAPDKLETVFELFQQADGSITRKYGGTGLGLAICKQIARLMQGEIWVESELGKGSTFHFTAWVDKSEKVFVKQPQVEFLAGKKALLVDDNENNLSILAHVMQLLGIRAETARRGGEVLPALQKAIAAQDPFDVCILDIQMPDMSGYEVSRQLRTQKEPLIANLKLLAFSSSVTKRIKMFKEAGFDGFLPKPIQRHTLITMLKRLLGDAGEEMETEVTREKAVVITQHTLAEEAKHSVRILLAEDNPMNQKLAQYMLTKAGYQLEVANNGREAVEKYTADPERYDLIFMDVHMPEIDGLAATKVLRNRGYAEIPIIAMTADAMKEDREKCLESGMNDYMAKPIKREEVFNMITKWVFKD
jgi:signal transduction histidine kinase/DNA-binding response OmpR family regulator